MRAKNGADIMAKVGKKVRKNKFKKKNETFSQKCIAKRVISN